MRTLLWLSDAPVPDNVRRATRDRWRVAPIKGRRGLTRRMDEATLVAIAPNGRSGNVHWLENVLNELDHASAIGVFLLSRDARMAWSLLGKRRGQFLCLPDDATPDELAANFEAAASLQPTIRHLQAELSAGRHMGASEEGARYLEELRLAARLQQDFLPARLPEVGPMRFGVVYRPASWVSGDIYDVVRLDETHVGFYVADAVGHGLPAALLTMFIKKALQTKRIVGSNYEIVPPDESLGGLNTDICEQNLSGCQFCTAVYFVADSLSMSATYARAGHPEPLLVRPNMPIQMLNSAGSLLGIFPDEEFAQERIGLKGGDRLIVYTDGAAEALSRSEGLPEPDLMPLAEGWRKTPRDGLLMEISDRIDRDREAVGPEDDATVIVVDIEE